MEQDSQTVLPAATRLAPQRQRTIVIAVAIAAAILVVLILIGRSLTAAAPAARPGPTDGSFRPTATELRQMRIVTVRDGALADVLKATGSIVVDGDHSTPILLPFSGQVAAVFVEPGQRVVIGQPLLRIASPELVDARNQLATSGAQQAAAAEAVRIAQANVARQKAIYETAGGALKDYSQAQNDLVVAQSALRTAQAAADAARGRLSIFGKTPGEARQLVGAGGARPDTIYRSPVAGVIADRSVAPGQFIAAGGSQPLMTITDPSRVWLVAQLDESDAAAVKLGDHVTVTTPALPGRQFTARIDNIGAALDPATHRLAVRASVANPDGALKPQMFASFAIQRPLGGGAGVVVPAAAVIHEGDDARVWMLGRDGLLHGRAVTAGLDEGGFVRITRGLAPGDRIVTQGALFVNEAGLDQ